MCLGVLMLRLCWQWILWTGDIYHIAASVSKVFSGKSFALYICFLAKKNTCSWFWPLWKVLEQGCLCLGALAKPACLFACLFEATLGIISMQKEVSLMDKVSKSGFHLKTLFFLMWPKCPGNVSFTSGELGSSSYTTGDPYFSAGLSGWERELSMRASVVVYFWGSWGGRIIWS